MRIAIIMRVFLIYFIICIFDGTVGTPEGDFLFLLPNEGRVTLPMTHPSRVGSNGLASNYFSKPSDRDDDNDYNGGYGIDHHISTKPYPFRCRFKGYFPKSGSCREYYYCEHQAEAPHSLSCSLGQVFSLTSQACVPASVESGWPECLLMEQNYFLNNQFPFSNETWGDESLRDIPGLKRTKRFAIATLLTGILAASSVVGTANALFNTGMSMSQSSSHTTDLRGIENKLTGIDGKLKDLEIANMESQLTNRIEAEVIKNLITKGTEKNQVNFHMTRKLINRGILENQIRTASLQGLIQQGNIENESNFAKVQVTLGELKNFINEEVTEAKEILERGFYSVSTNIEQLRIEPIVSELLLQVRGLRERTDHLNSLPDKNKKDEIERSGGYLEYFSSSIIQDTLYKIIQQNLALPSSESDLTAVFMFDLLIDGLQVQANKLSLIVSSNAFLATKALEEVELEEFNLYMQRLNSAISRVKISLGYNRGEGLISEVKTLITKIKQLPFAPKILILSDILDKRLEDIAKIEYDIEKLIASNKEIDRPGKISGKPNFSTSSVSVPVGSWEAGKKVMYAIQLISEGGLSSLGEWSSPYTISDKACPIVKLPTTESGVIRLLYRKFNEEKPELVAIVNDNSKRSIRDIERDIINAATSPNEDLAVKDIEVLLQQPDADVNIYLENKMTPLHYAAKNGNSKIMDILISNNADIHAKTSDNEEPLHFAAVFGAKEGIEYLIKKKAEVNAQTRLLGLSPLHIAVANNHVEAAQALIGGGAFINIKDNNGLTPLHTAVAGNGDAFDILLEYEIDVNAVANDGLTPLHYAARCYNEVFTKKLLEESSIDVNAKNDNSLTPLHFAAVSGNAVIIAELYQRGASASAVDKYGSTALHYAAYYGNKQAVLLLLQLDPSLEFAKNIEGQTASDLAVRLEREEVLSILNSTEENRITVLEEEFVDNNAIPESDPPNDPTSTTCSGEIGDQLADRAVQVCTHVSNVDSYVTLVMSMVPLNKYYKNQPDYSEIFENYDGDLLIAQNHSNIWRNGDSIVKGISQTFELSKEFENVFRKKYRINKQRVQKIKANADQMKIILELEEDIRQLEERKLNVTATMEFAEVPQIKRFFQQELDRINEELAEKNRLLEEDYTLSAELEELAAFLEFVRMDSQKIQNIATKTKGKLETFRTYLERDKGAFERHGNIAKQTVEKLENETIEAERELAKLRQDRIKLEQDIEKERNEIEKRYKQIENSFNELNKMKRELMKRMKTSSILKIVGAVLTPFLPVVGIPLLIYGSVSEKKMVQSLQATIDDNNKQVQQIHQAIKYKNNQIDQYRERMANSSHISGNIREELRDFSSLDIDLKDVSFKIKTLVEAISKALDGVNAIKGIFDEVTTKLEEMINLAKEAKSEAEKRNARYFIYNELSLLECNWNDVYLKVRTMDECTKYYKANVGAT